MHCATMLDSSRTAKGRLQWKSKVALAIAGHGAGMSDEDRKRGRRGTKPNDLSPHSRHSIRPQAADIEEAQRRGRQLRNREPVVERRCLRIACQQ